MVMDTEHLLMDILLQENKISQDLSQKRSSWIFFALSFISCIPLLYLFWKFGEAGFGYDIGIYRRTALEYFENFKNPNTPAFAFTAFSNFLFLVGDSLNSFLLTWYILLSGLTSYTFALLVKKISSSNILGAIALLLFSTSLIQFEFFAGFYYRNLLALFLLFSTLLLLEYKSYTAALPLLILSAIHPLSTFVFAPTLLILGIFQKENRKLFFSTLCIAGFGSLFLSWNEFWRYLQTLFGFLQNREASLAHSSEFTGQFISSSQFFRFTLPYLPFACIGIFRESKKHMFWIIFGLINLGLIVFQFFLFERFYLFLNIVLIFFAAYGIVFIFEYFQNKKLFWILTVAYAFFLLSAQMIYVTHKIPLIPPSELKEIQSLKTFIPKKSFILSFSSSDAPWLYGFAGDYKIIAPGTLHENKWNFDNWSEFWSTKDTKKRATLLSQYNTPEIFIYTSEAFAKVGQDLFSDDPNIQKINSHLWKYQFSPSL